MQLLLFLSFPVLTVGALAIRSAVVRGQWHEPAIGRAVTGVRLRDAGDTIFTLPYPSVVYVHSMACRFCPAAGSRLAAYVDSARGHTLPVFALSHDGRTDATRDSGWGTALTVARLAERNPAFSFVRDIPMTIRIGADGIIERAYVGIPRRAELESLLALHQRESHPTPP